MTASSEKEFAAVALNVPVPGPFHYRVPEALRGVIAPGARVRVEFGRRRMVGYCVELTDHPDVDESLVKNILQLVDRPPLLDADMLELTRWMASYYCCSWGEALNAVLPSAVKKGGTAKTVMLVAAAKSAPELRERAARIERRAPRQARALYVLAGTRGEITARDLVSLAEVDHSVVSALRRGGYVNVRRDKVADDPSLAFEVEQAQALDPTPDQTRALSRIDAALSSGTFHVALLHGVTGSGKTEVYLQALRRVVNSGRQGIVLVPEISLTPQTVARFKARFDRVCVLHSELTDSKRRAEWRKIRDGKADVVIGARSAVFAPVPRLGLLVVDEEHEGSFKQQSVPRYHGRDVGIWRAQQENALVLLGSATPALESFHNACSGKYELLKLPRRIEGRPLPPVHIHDMTHDLTSRGATPLLSRKLRLALESTLQKGEQVILLLNRRGYHTHITCPRCGFVLRCKQCDVSLIYHRASDVTRCHYCGYESTPPVSCPGCGLAGIKYKGCGTQRIEEELGKLFGPENVARMDSDAMRGRGRYEKTLGNFRDGKTRILLGTQMVAKGLDFPNVTLVGVVNADVSLHLPDFRASERTFQLLTQVAGRAGRSAKGGRVIVQTFSPDHPSVLLAASHDYEGFAAGELAARKRFGYPPFARLARIVFEGRDLDAVSARSRDTASAISAAIKGLPVRLLGPTAAPISRIKGRFRHHMLIKAPDSALLHKALGGADRRRAGGVRVTIDVDPVSLL